MPVFTANVPRPLMVGDRIEIGGKIKENAKKMSINLCAQLGDEPRDVVLHFDVRFRRDNIVSLSRKNGIWIGSGSYDTNYNMFVPGTSFRIVFQVKDADVIKIYCQGKFHSNFLPKIPISRARYLVAWCDIDRVTDCFFYFADMTASGDEDYCHQRPVLPKLSVLKKSLKSKKQDQESAENSAEGLPKTCNRQGSRADRYFYETLMCQSGSLKLAESIRRRPPGTRPPDEYRRFTNTSEGTNSTFEHSDESEVSSDTESDSDSCNMKRRPVRSPDLKVIKKC